MADEILPEVEEPNVEIEQFLVNDSAEDSTEAPLPLLVMGPKTIGVSPTTTQDIYEGSILNTRFPNFETSSVVLDDTTLSVKLKNIKVRLGEEVNKATVSHATDDIILTITDGTNPIPAAAKGYAQGDLLTIRKSIHSAATGDVLITSRTKLTNSASGTAFAAVIPGDILVFKTSTEFGNTSWKSTVSATIKEYSVIEVGTGGAYIIVAENLEVGTGMSFNVVREVSTTIASLSPINTPATQVNVSSFVDTGAVEFKASRILTTGLSTGDQPLASDYVVSSSNHSIVDGVDAGDTLRIVAGLEIPLFTNFPLELGTGGVVILTNANLLTVTGVDLTTGDNAVTAGDTIYFKNTSNTAISATVASVALNGSDTEITLVQAQLTDVTASKVYGSYKDGVGIPLPITFANVEIGYRAKSLLDAYKVIKIAKTTDLDQLGERAVYNEIRVAAQIGKQNAGLNAMYAIITEDNSLESYAKALEVAEGTNSYLIVPLTQSINVLSSAKVHVDSMSVAKKAKWRCMFGNIAKPLEAAVVPLRPSGVMTLTVTKTGSAIATGSKVTLVDPTASFTTTVFAGMYLKFYEQAGVANPLPQTGGTLPNSASFVDSSDVTKYFRIYKVKTKLSNTKLELEPLPYNGEVGVYNGILESAVVAENGVTYTGKYEIIEILTKDQIAQEVGKTVRSFNDRRVNIVTNSTCGIAFTNSAGVEVIEPMKGYMICAGLAGLASNTQPHQPMSRLSIAGIARIYDGLEFYSSTQFSVMATGGGWNMAQDAADALPYTWRQRTTSQAGIKEKEWSVTKNVDEICKALRNDLNPSMGPNNLVDQSVRAADQQVTTTLEARTTIVPGHDGSIIGPQIIEYSQTGSVKVPLLLDTTLNKISLTVPIPYNKMKIEVYA